MKELLKPACSINRYLALAVLIAGVGLAAGWWRSQTRRLELTDYSASGIARVTRDKDVDNLDSHAREQSSGRDYDYPSAWSPDIDENRSRPHEQSGHRPETAVSRSARRVQQIVKETGPPADYRPGSPKPGSSEASAVNHRPAGGPALTLTPGDASFVRDKDKGPIVSERGTTTAVYSSPRPEAKRVIGDLGGLLPEELVPMPSASSSVKTPRDHDPGDDAPVLPDERLEVVEVVNVADDGQQDVADDFPDNLPTTEEFANAEGKLLLTLWVAADDFPAEDIPNAVVLTQPIPEGWEILSADPLLESFDLDTREAKWLIFGADIDQERVFALSLQQIDPAVGMPPPAWCVYRVSDGRFVRADARVAAR